jgi:hypothetical protein
MRGDRRQATKGNPKNQRTKEPKNQRTKNLPPLLWNLVLLFWNFIMDLACPACGRTLRLADEHSGKQIRCPACQQVSIAPAGESGEQGDRGQGTGDRGQGSDGSGWHLRMPGGPIYGPVGWDDITAWAREGRIAADCELAEAARGPWRAATTVLPQLVVSLPQPMAAGTEAAYPWTTGLASAEPSGGYVAPHRGGLILALGLLSWIGCPLLSFASWVMGSHDLREMRAGRMDKSGESTTMAGMILGMIVSVLWLLAGAALAVMLLIVAVFQ